MAQRCGKCKRVKPCGCDVTADALKDRTPLRFGKYRGKTPEEVAACDPSYVVWMHANVIGLGGPPCSRELARKCEDEVNYRESSREPDELDNWARGIADE